MLCPQQPRADNGLSQRNCRRVRNRYGVVSSSLGDGVEVALLIVYIQFDAVFVHNANALRFR